MIFACVICSVSNVLGAVTRQREFNSTFSLCVIGRAEEEGIYLSRPRELTVFTFHAHGEKKSFCVFPQRLVLVKEKRAIKTRAIKKG